MLGDQYVPTDTVFFEGQVQTACGGALERSDPSLPGDSLVYIDLSFDQLQSQFGAQGGLFVNAYVIAHEYAHHVQNLLGINQQVTPGELSTGGARAAGGRFAGAANHAETVPDQSGDPLIAEINADDTHHRRRLAGSTTSSSGSSVAQVDQDAFTHGSSEQRRQWFTTGYETGDPKCDTFATDDLGDDE